MFLLPSWIEIHLLGKKKEGKRVFLFPGWIEIHLLGKKEGKGVVLLADWIEIFHSQGKVSD